MNHEITHEITQSYGLYLYKNKQSTKKERIYALTCFLNATR